MRPALLSVLALVNASLLAQAPMNSPVTAPACAVGLYAQQRGPGAAVWTTALEDVVHPPSDRHGVHVVVTHAHIPIRAITFRVTFLPYGLRAIPTDSVSRRNLEEQSRTFTLSPKGDADAKLTADLLLGLVSGVRRVSVAAIEYADGSSWKASAANPCSVTPSGYVPVTAEAH